MDGLNIGETILRLRKQRNFTQEQLASMVGVSAGAVSKWENGNSTPDISLLAPLARALNTSLDTLLCFQPQLSDGEVSEIKQQLIKTFLHEGYGAGESKCLKYLNEYANNLRLKYEVSALIYVYLMMAEEPTEEFIKSKRLYCLALLQQVAESRDPKYTPMALFSIAQIQMEMGDYDESEKALKQLPLYPIDPAILYMDLYMKQEKDNETMKLCSGKLFNYINHSCTILIMLARVSKKAQNYNKAELYLDACYKLQETFKMGMGSASYNYCRLYIDMDQKEVAARWFKTYVEEVTTAQYDHHRNPYFEEIKLEVNPEEQKIIRKKLLQVIIAEEEFKVLSGIEDYEEAINTVKEAIQNI